MTATTDEQSAQVCFRVRRGLGWITLNRPRAINALTHSMVTSIDGQLRVWAEDDAVEGVVLTGAGDRGLCAGGDIRAIYDDARNAGSATVDFWRDEYVLDDLIARYPKPYLAVMNGLVMGGGVGVSAHASHRLVTDDTVIAMPETGIGFCPDVGGTWLLSHAPGELGTHLALTGTRIGPGDAIRVGLADHYIPQAALGELLDRLDADQLGAFPSTPAPTGFLDDQRHWIDAAYAGSDPTRILDRLDTVGLPAADAAAGRIRAASPSAVWVTLRALRTAASMTSLREALDQELVLSTAALRSHDLVEGIRAQIIDKDRQPRWAPATLADVPPDLVDRYFLGMQEADR